MLKDWKGISYTEMHMLSDKRNNQNNNEGLDYV